MGAPFDSREYVVCLLSAGSTSVCVCVGGGGSVDSKSGLGMGGECCPILADLISEVSTLSADSTIQSVVGGVCFQPWGCACMQTFITSGGGRCHSVPKVGGHGPSSAPLGTPMRTCVFNIFC